MSIIIKRWADPAIPFYQRYYLNLRLETFRKDWCPTSIDVGQIKMSARSIFTSPPLLKRHKYGKLFFLTSNYAIFWKSKKLASSFWFKMPNIGAKVAAECWASKSPIVNISYYNIFGTFNADKRITRQHEVVGLTDFFLAALRWGKSRLLP